MTIEETGAIMDVLKAAFPQFHKEQTEEEQLDSIKLWTDMFAEDELALVAAAVKAYIATEKKGFTLLLAL